jgi:hypothetical protein
MSGLLQVKEFLLILFFSKMVLLTPDPVDLYGEKDIYPKDLLTAITSGASVEVDVTDFMGGIDIKKIGIVESRKLLEEKIPEGSVKCVLYSSTGEKIYLDDTGYALSNNAARLTLSASSGVPTNIKFNKVVITSRINLKGVKVYWKNSKH